MFNAGRRAGVVVSLVVLTQAGWWLDPANSTGLASDANTGASAITPLLTHEELHRRRMAAAAAVSYSAAAGAANYNGQFPILQNTTVTYLSAPPSPYADSIMMCIARSATFTLNYIFPSATVRSGVFTALTVRGGVNYWKATGAFGSADVQKLAFNTTKNTAFWVNAQTGGVADTSEFIGVQATPFNTFFPAPVITAPASTDAYDVKTLCRVHLGLITVDGIPTAAGALRVSCVSFLNFQFAADSAAPGFGYPDTCTITGNNGAFASGFVYTGVSFTQCSFEGKIQGINVYLSFWNCQILGTLAMTNGEAVMFGGIVYNVQSIGSVIGLSGYVCLAGGVTDGIQPGAFNIGGVVLYIFASDLFTVSRGGTQILLSDPFFGTCEIVGHGSRYMFRLSNGAVVLNPAALSWVTVMKATTITFAVLDGQFNALAYDPVALTTGTTAIAVTPANLDLALGSGGFGGWAVIPATGTAMRKQQS